MVLIFGDDAEFCREEVAMMVMNKPHDSDLLELCLGFGRVLLASNCLPPSVRPLLEEIRPRIESGAITTSDILLIQGLSAILAGITQRRLVPVIPEHERTRAPEDRLRELLRYNRIVAQLRDWYPVPENPFTDVVMLDCMDARLNSGGAYWLDYHHRVDSLKAAGGAILPSHIESVAGAVALHDIKLGLFFIHTDCGLRRVAAHRRHRAHAAARETVEASRLYDQRLEWLLEDATVQPKVADGTLWIMVGQIVTETKQFSQLHRVTLQPDSGLWYSPVELAPDGDRLIIGEASQQAPDFFAIHVHD